MSGILFDVLEINIAVSIIIIILYLSAGKLRARYGAAWMKMVWLILVVRLLIPYNFSLPNVGIHLFNMLGFEEEGVFLDVTGQQADSGDSGFILDADRNEDVNLYGNGNGATGTEEIGGHIGMQDDAGDNITSDIKNASGGASNKEADSMKENNSGNVAGGGNASLPITDGAAGAGSVFFRFFNAEMLVRIWLFGCGIAFCYMIVSYFIFYRRSRKGLSRIRDKELYQRLAAIQKEQIGKACIPVYTGQAVKSPMLIGILRPRLLLPAARKKWNDRELELMMAHELCHYRQKDLVLKFMMMTVCCIHWFNPAVYLMKKQFFYEIELACDENVLRKCGGKERELYAQMILSFAGSRRENAAFSTGMWENKKRMKNRLAYMLDERRRKKGVVSIVITVMAVLLTGLVVSCGYKTDEENAQDRTEASGAETQEHSPSDAVRPEADENLENMDALQKEEAAAFDYNHEYNEMLRSYENDIFLAREDGIYCLENGEGEEKLLYENSCTFRRGMELYKNYLYFCGSAQRGEEESATIYRMNLDTLEVEDVLAAFSRTFDILYEISIYEGNLYVCEGMEKRIGFVLDENGLVVGQLDEEAEDFLYREYNEYIELELARLNAEFDTEEYWELTEEVDSKYEAVMDVAACKKLLDGKQVVSRYKDELLRSLYLENEDGTYEYLCDSVRLPVLVTEDGMYYLLNEAGDVWYIDFATRTPRLFYERQAKELDSIYLINYDAEYVYLLKNRHIGYDADDISVAENFLLRVPRQGGEAERVYQFEQLPSLNMPYSVYRHCAVYDNRMFFDELAIETISLNPEENGMLKGQELSEDAAEMKRIAEGFMETISPEQAEQVRMLYISGLPEGNLAVGTKCYVSCELAIDPEAEDELSYLTIEMVKTEEGFSVQGYDYAG